MIDENNKTTMPKEVPAPPAEHEADQEKATQQVRDDKEMREGLSEHQIDKSLKDSFPASDPPGRY